MGLNMIVGRQIRAARALIDMSQDELAEATGLTPQAIRKIEAGTVTPREGTMSDIFKALSNRGIEFTDGQGVKLKSSDLEVFEGPDRFDEFYEYMYQHLSQHGGEVCVSVSDENLLSKYRKDPDIHRQRMKKLVDKGKVSFRILTMKSNFSSSYALYKWQKSDITAPTSFYAFGDCLALISFLHHSPPYVVLIRSAPLANAYRESFNVAWREASDPPRNKES